MSPEGIEPSTNRLRAPRRPEPFAPDRSDSRTYGTHLGLSQTRKDACSGTGCKDLQTTSAGDQPPRRSDDNSSWLTSVHVYRQSIGAQEQDRRSKAGLGSFRRYVFHDRLDAVRTDVAFLRFEVFVETCSGSFFLPVSRFHSSNVWFEILPSTRSCANLRRCALLLNGISVV